MDNVATKLRTFEKPVRVNVEYTDGFVNYIYDCVGIYLSDGVLKFEILVDGRSRFRCFELDMVYKFVIFEGDSEGKEGALGRKKLPTFAS